MKLSNGRYLNDRMSTYLIPTAADAPPVEVILVEEAHPHGPSGAKGMGELPMSGGAPALVQAIENAAGLVPSTLPVTPEHLLTLLNTGQTVEGLVAPGRKENQ
jgi:CO/xanthine dehydrogenase Mo-binding subunit